MKTTIKLNETQLRRVVSESVKKALKESDFNNTDYDMSPEAVATRNQNSGYDAKRQFRHILNWLAQSIQGMRAVHEGNVNYQHTSFELEEDKAKRALVEFDKLLSNVSIEYLD